MKLATFYMFLVLLFSLCEYSKAFGEEFADCYQQYGNGTRDSEPVHRLRYFKLFTRRQSTAPNEERSLLHSCWDEQYADELDEIICTVKSTQIFASFNPSHAEAVAKLGQLIQSNLPQSNDQLLDFLEYLLHYRGDIHPHLFLHAVQLTAISTDCPLLSYARPSLPEIFPTSFFPNIGAIWRQGKQQQGCIQVNELWGDTPTNGVENRLWYFREDIQMNYHHMTWHLHYPVNAPVDMKRRGEFFYFFHHDLLARYAAERMANGFSDYHVDGVRPVDNFVVLQGYDSNLVGAVSSMNWVNRPNRTRLSSQTLNRNLYQQLLFHETWWGRVNAITETGNVVRWDSQTIPLLPDGTHTIGNLFEASNWTINQAFYGRNGWHGSAHVIIGGVKVRQFQSDRQYGVLADISTSFRDIVFFQIHSEVDKMFLKYKYNLLNPYELSQGDHPLILGGIKVNSVSIVGANGHDYLTTFWNNTNMIVNGGLDFQAQNLQLTVCMKHMDHEEFAYNIVLVNQNSAVKNVMIRIYMAPRKKLDGTRFIMGEQTGLFFMMDAFPKTVNPGKNLITRRSQSSTVTRDWWTPADETDADVDADCPCGFPEHLLLPKGGIRAGIVYDVVVLVTDGADFSMAPTDFCYTSWVHCGQLGRLGYQYPDSKPMGYPWDRRPADGMGEKYLEDFISQIPNAGMTTVSIWHDDTTPAQHLVKT